jgi:hypothetical protein
MKGPVPYFPVLLAWWLATLGTTRAAVLQQRREYIRAWSRRNPGKKKANDAASYLRHKVTRIAGMRRWAVENVEQYAEYRRPYHVQNRESLIAKAVKWQQENRVRRNATLRTWTATQQANNLHWRIKKNLATRIWWALHAKVCGSKNVPKLLGCTVKELKAHLAAQFRPGMSWGNYGEWHIDHLRPCASFDLTDPEQQRQCFNYTNLQPLWAKDNLSKGSRYAPQP